MRMPAIFVGHGSPMNAISHNEYTKAWREIGEKYKPKGILMLSGHWFTKGSRIQNDPEPQKINDMYGFPRELYELAYPVTGHDALTKEVMAKLGDNVEVDNSWGIDHGTWSVLTHMYPTANIPVVQLSVDISKSPIEQIEVGKAIQDLRDQGYMIMGSGNVVHNLRVIDQSLNTGFDWAIAFDEYIESSITHGRFDECANYLSLGDAAKLAVPTTEHFYPLLSVLGTVGPEDEVTVFNKGYDMGGLSMTSYIFK